MVTLKSLWRWGIDTPQNLSDGNYTTTLKLESKLSSTLHISQQEKFNQCKTYI